MKRIILASAAALFVAGPVFASSQLEAKLGVEPGVYTTAELASLALGQNHETGDGPRARIGDISDTGVNMTTSNGSVSSFAITQVGQFHETGDGPRFANLASDGVAVYSNADNAARALEIVNAGKRPSE